MIFLDHNEAELLNTLPSLPFARLVRQDKKPLAAAKDALESRGELPTFSYSRALAFETGMYRRALDGVRVQFADRADIVGELYREKCHELATRIDLLEAVQQQDDETVTRLSENIYGTPIQSEQELRDEFSDVLARASRLYQHRETVTADLFVRMIERVLAHYDITDWRIKLSNQLSVRIGHHEYTGERPPVIHIPKTLRISRARAARLLTHEIEVHALRTANGAHSSLRLLARGLAHYTRTDEGLAIYMQQKLRSPEAVDAGFWDAWATVLTRTHNFREVYEILFDAQRQLGEAIGEPDPVGRAKDAAWRLCVRVYRGITHPGNAGVGYMRDHIYRSGLIEVRQYLQTQGESALPALFVGHCSISHLPLLGQLGISRSRTPDMIGRKTVIEVMREHRRASKT